MNEITTQIGRFDCVVQCAVPAPDILPLCGNNPKIPAATQASNHRTDLQGLDYELARPLKAYFVMMQHVIAIALREGRSFVDFGPTTPKPKCDIGCVSVGITGAMYANSPILRTAIRIAANKVTESLHE